MEIHFTISNFSNLATTVFTFPLIIIILKIISEDDGSYEKLNYGDHKFANKSGIP